MFQTVLKLDKDIQRWGGGVDVFECLEKNALLT